MKEILLTRASLIWLALMVLTVASWLLGTGLNTHFFGIHAEGSAILILAMIKARMIINNFMEVRHAPTALKLCCDAWTIAVAASMLGIYNNWISFV